MSPAVDAAIAAAKAKFPDLTRWGLGRPDSDEPFNPKCVATAMAFLAKCDPTEHPVFSSYYLKHVAEEWGRSVGLEPYVANGELIAAAVALGLRVERSSVGINALIGVSERSIRRLNNRPRRRAARR